MLEIAEIIIVEGRYDKNTLSQIVSATIIETSGFGIFKDKEKLQLIRRLAAQRGLVILTDSDSAGFQIRNYLKGSLSAGRVLHAYIPDRFGKERRKSAPGKEGKIGVEGMEKQLLLQALQDAGATFLNQGEGPANKGPKLGKAQLYEAGLSGGKDSSARRKALLKQLDLPENLTTNGLIDVLNALYSLEEAMALISGMNEMV